MTGKLQKTTPQESEILFYTSSEGDLKIDVYFHDETVWLTQKRMAELFDVEVNTVNYHLKEIFKGGELKENSVIRKIRITAADGKNYPTNFYNLDVIIAVGYRVNSKRATQFRIWATRILRDFIVKGFVLDDERLKGGSGLVDYFDELLARIREIRASEARVYQRIREIFALACDYREGEEETQVFFATMQNKMHYAATGMTAAEIIHQRAAAAGANMGLTSWKGGRVLKCDVGTAKNYLGEKDIDTLNRITVMFLDQGEFRAQRRQDIQMGDWEAFLDKFLCDTELPVLIGSGSVSHDDALEFAHQQYETFVQRRRMEAEAKAEDRYVEDLRTSAKLLEGQRKKPQTPKNGKKKKNKARAKEE